MIKKWFKKFIPSFFISFFLLNLFLFPQSSLALISDGNYSIQDEVMDEGGGPVRGGAYNQPNSSVGQPSQGRVLGGSYEMLGGHTYKDESSPVNTIEITYNGTIWIEQDKLPNDGFYFKRNAEDLYNGNIRATAFGVSSDCSSCSEYTLKVRIPKDSVPPTIRVSGFDLGYSAVSYHVDPSAPNDPEDMSNTPKGNGESYAPTIVASSDQTIYVNFGIKIVSWFQISGGDVHNSSGNLSSPVPGSYSFDLQPTKSILTSDGEVALGSDTTPVDQLRRVESYNNSLTTPSNRQDFDYFYNLAGRPTSPAFDINNPPTAAGEYLYYNPRVLVIDRNWDLSSGVKVTIFVEGYVIISNRVNIPTSNSSLVLIAKKNIDIIGDLENGVNPVLEGIYITNESINTNSDGDLTPPRRLIGKGLFVAWNNSGAATGGFILGRNLGSGNSTLPAEQFTYRPDLLINAPRILKKSFYTWQEVTQ